jgi:hypothetical protein
VLAVLAGGVPAAALVALRAVALGTRVLVRTARPQAWHALLRAVPAPGVPVALVPPDGPLPGPTGPQLIVLDGTSGAPDVPAAPWRTTLLLRDRLTAADVAVLGRADLAILQPLPPDEAALAGTALGLGGSRDWLAAIRADMVAVVSHGSVRWARLSATPIERQAVGDPARPAASAPVSG